MIKAITHKKNTWKLDLYTCIFTIQQNSRNLKSITKPE